jgi:hypothetical protein
MTCYEEDEFFRLISRDSSSAERLIIRLCERLRNITRKYTETAILGKNTCPDEAIATVSGPEMIPLQDGRKKTGSTKLRLTLFSSSPQMTPLLPEEGIAVMELPFTVGRLPEGNEPEPTVRVDLKIPDSVPFRLSRLHFALYQASEGVGILDFGSALGTELNGDFLGRDFGKDFKYLIMGENRITAGGRGSPFTFKAIMAPA